MQPNQFYLSPDQIKPLISLPGGGIATNRITVEGKPVRFMYRAQPTNPADSGWRFFSGDSETQEYLDDPKNAQVFSLNTIVNYDQSIIPYLQAPVGTVLEKPDGSEDWLIVKDFEIPS